MSIVVRMRVGEAQFALPIEHVREIGRLGAISPLPGTTSMVLGVRNLRGQVLPVFDLAALLGVAASGRCSRVVVVEHGGRRAGLAIDAITDVGALPDASPGASSEFVLRTVRADGHEIDVLDAGRVFAALQDRAAL